MDERRICLLGGLLVGLSAGCRAADTAAHRPATLQDQEFDEFGEEGDAQVFDPLERYNRVAHGFNDKLFLWVWNPTAKAYRLVAPQPARVALDRAFKNAATPVRFANGVLQLDLGKAGTELGRLAVNTTLGIGGLFDPADSWFGWRAPPREDFGQTLGSYGVGTGFPIVLPLFGPSNLRDTIGLVPDVYLHPATHLLSTAGSLALDAGTELNRTSLHIGEYESLKADALDHYALMRDVYQQNREKAIRE